MICIIPAKTLFIIPISVNISLHEIKQNKADAVRLLLDQQMPAEEA